MSSDSKVKRFTTESNFLNHKGKCITPQRGLKILMEWGDNRKPHDTGYTLKVYISDVLSKKIKWSIGNLLKFELKFSSNGEFGENYGVGDYGLNFYNIINNNIFQRIAIGLLHPFRDPNHYGGPGRSPFHFTNKELTRFKYFRNILGIKGDIKSGSHNNEDINTTILTLYLGLISKIYPYLEGKDIKEKLSKIQIETDFKKILINIVTNRGIINVIEIEKLRKIGVRINKTDPNGVPKKKITTSLDYIIYTIRSFCIVFSDEVYQNHRIFIEKLLKNDLIKRFRYNKPRKIEFQNYLSRKGILIKGRKIYTFLGNDTKGRPTQIYFNNIKMYLEQLKIYKSTIKDKGELKSLEKIIYLINTKRKGLEFEGKIFVLYKLTIAFLQNNALRSINEYLDNINEIFIKDINEKIPDDTIETEFKKVQNVLIQKKQNSKNIANFINNHIKNSIIDNYRAITFINTIYESLGNSRITFGDYNTNPNQFYKNIIFNPKNAKKPHKNGRKAFREILIPMIQELFNLKFYNSTVKLRKQPKVRVYGALSLIIKFLTKKEWNGYKDKILLKDGLNNCLKAHGIYGISDKFLKELFLHPIVQKVIGKQINVLSSNFTVEHWFKNEFNKKIIFVGNSNVPYSIGSVIHKAYHDIAKDIQKSRIALKKRGIYIVDYNNLDPQYIDSKKVKAIWEVINFDKNMVDQLKELEIKLDSLLNKKSVNTKAINLIYFKVEVINLLLPVDDCHTELAASYLDQIRRLVYTDSLKELNSKQFAETFKLCDNYINDSIIRALHAKWTDIVQNFLEDPNTLYKYEYSSGKRQISPKDYAQIEGLPVFDHFEKTKILFYNALAGVVNGRIKNQADTNYQILEHFGIIEYKRVHQYSFNDFQFRFNFINSLAEFNKFIPKLNKNISLKMHQSHLKNEKSVNRFIKHIKCFLPYIYQNGYLSCDDKSLIHVGVHHNKLYIGILTFETTILHWKTIIHLMLDKLKYKMIMAVPLKNTDRTEFDKKYKKLKSYYVSLMNPF